MTGPGTAVGAAGLVLPAAIADGSAEFPCPGCSKLTARYDPRRRRFSCADGCGANGDRWELLTRFGRPAPSAPAAPVGPALVVTSLADVRPMAVRWHWPRWLAMGKLHILGGHPGDGKSTLTAALAAIFSTGGYLPDGTPAPTLRTLFLLAEDALDDTLRPRLDAHGADAHLIAAVESVREDGTGDRLFNLIDHLPLLEGTIRERRIDVVVIDPLTSFLPQCDRNAEGDVRDALTPAGKLAERLGVAVIAIMHIGKAGAGSGRRPLQQLLGATAFGAIARVVWMVAPCPNDETGARRVLGVAKSNLATKPKPIEWSRAEDGPIVWHGESAHDLDALLGGAVARPRDDAEGFLAELLKGGSRPATEVKRLAEAAGIAPITLRRAADALTVKRRKQPGVSDGPWLWSLPDGDPIPGAAEGDHFRDAGESWEGDHPSMAEVITFDSSHDSGKMITRAGTHHLRPEGEVDHLRPSNRPAKVITPSNGDRLRADWGRIEGDHLSIYGTDHLRLCVECQAPLPATVSGFYCLRHGGTVADPALAGLVEGLLQLNVEELRAYREELANPPAHDPPSEDELAALEIAEASMACASPNGKGCPACRS